LQKPKIFVGSKGEGMGGNCPPRWLRPCKQRLHHPSRQTTTRRPTYIGLKLQRASLIYLMYPILLYGLEMHKIVRPNISESARAKIIMLINRVAYVSNAVV